MCIHEAVLFSEIKVKIVTVKKYSQCINGSCRVYDLEMIHI